MNANTDASQSNRKSPNEVFHQKIEERAYQLWLESGGGHGDHERHWLQAEMELMEAAKQERERRSDVRNGKKTDKPHKS